MNSISSIDRAARLYVLMPLLLLTVSTAACSSEAPAAAANEAARGAQLFEAACAKCHGSDGSGGLPMATNGPKPIDLRNADWHRSRTDEEIVTTIRDGRGAMPPFRDVLSADQMRALVARVRLLNRSIVR